MLKKLIKHDVKSNIKVIAGAYSLITLFAILHLIMEKLYKAYPWAVQWSVLENILFILHILSVGAGFAITIITSVLYYRKSMFKDESYLTHTLPVSETMIFTSKYLSALILFIINIVGAYITMSISVGSPLWCIKFIKGFADGMKESGFTILSQWLVVISLVVGALYGISQLFGSITIGYSFGKKMNKDVCSFLTYFIGYVVMQVFSIAFVVIAAAGRGMMTKLVESAEAPDMGVLNACISDVLIGSIILMIVMMIFYCGMSVYLLNKKLNVD